MRHIILILSMAVLAAPAWAQNRDLVVGVEELDYYPAYATVEQEYIGAARDILDSFAKDRGYRITYRPLPVKRLFAELVAGGIDAKFPDSPDWAADLKAGREVAYSGPVIEYVDGVLVPPAALGQGLDSVRVLGIVSGFTPFAWLDRIQSGAVQVKENPKFELLVRQAILKRVDGIYASVAAANHNLDRVVAMPGALVFDPALPHTRDAYRLSSATRPEMIAEFNAWLDANQARVAEIKRRFQAEKGVH